MRTAKHLLLQSTTKPVEPGTYDVICQFCTVKGTVVESEVLKAQNCALSNFSLPMHSNEVTFRPVLGRDQIRTSLTIVTSVVCTKCTSVQRDVVENAWPVKPDTLFS